MLALRQLNIPYKFFFFLSFFNLASFFNSDSDVILFYKINFFFNYFIKLKKKPALRIGKLSKVYINLYKKNNKKPFVIKKLQNKNHRLLKSSLEHYSFFKTLKSNFFFIVGGLMSPYKWSFVNKDKRSLKLREARTFLKKSVNLKKTPPLFKINVFKNFFKLRLKNSKYLFKSINTKIKNKGKIAKYPQKPYSMFKKYKPILSKSSCCFLKFNLFFKQYQKIFKKNIFFFKKIRTKKNFSQDFWKKKSNLFLNNSLFFFSYKKFRKTSPLFIKNEKYSLKVKTCLNLKTKKPFFKKSLRFLFKKYAFFNKFVLNTNLIDASTGKFLFDFVFKRAFLIDFVFIKKTLYKNKTHLFYKTIYKRTLNNLSFFKNNKTIRKPLYSLAIKSKQNSTVFKKKIFKSDKPLFNSISNSNFISSSIGFLLISRNLYIPHLLNVAKSELKKKYYSFSVRNDLQKFIIKKYVKQTSITFFLNKFNIKERMLGIHPFFKNQDNFSYLNIFINSKKNIYSYNNQIFKTFSFQKASLFFNNDENDYLKKEASLNIRKIRFKPGYMTIWREAREVIKEIRGLNFRYQYRLTRYLTKFFKLIKVNLILSSEMQLKNIIVKSGMLIEQHVVKDFIEYGFFYINGNCCSNTTFQVHTGDFIQMVLNIKYYITYRWLSHWIGKKKLKLKLRTRKKLSVPISDQDKIRTKTFPTWILLYKNFKEDTPTFMELDFLTLSIFIIHEPRFYTDINADSLIWDRYSILNMYNWKYIN